MTNNQHKKTYFKIFFIAVLFTLFFCIFSLKISAAGLEVTYPTISGTTINETTQLPGYILYLFNLGMFVGFFIVFLSFIAAGVMYITSALSIDLRTKAKDQISGAISGMLILLLTYLIVTTINPQLSFLNFNQVSQTPTTPETKRNAGVYFYKVASDCPDKFNNAQSYTSDTADLGGLRNQVNSVETIQDENNSYLSILYDSVNFEGRCQYINPNQGCQNITPSAASASILNYDPYPNGDGVYFYRKSYFDSSGGYYKVDNFQIQNKFIGDLSKLQFQGVPDEEKDCTKYNKNGDCINKESPYLSGKNILSVKIKGNYFVLFIYKSAADNVSGPWAFCQGFPTTDDVNKIGPAQIDYESIRNIGGNLLPNYVVIIPVKKK